MEENHNTMKQLAQQLKTSQNWSTVLYDEHAQNITAQSTFARNRRLRAVPNSDHGVFVVIFENNGRYDQNLHKVLVDHDTVKTSINEINAWA